MRGKIRLSAGSLEARVALIESGKGSVLLQVQSLAEMGAPVKKQLQMSLLDSAATESSDDASDADTESTEAQAASSSMPLPLDQATLPAADDAAAKPNSVVPLKARTNRSSKCSFRSA